MAEKMVEKVLRLMSKPANIRNICTSAHIDHGKCISGDSRLMLGDGRILAAEQLFKIAETEGTKAFEDQNKVIYNTNSAGIKAVSLNKKTGKLEHKQIQFAWKLSGGRTIRVTAKTGLQIETTPEHKYMVLEEMEFKEKEAEKLKLRDKIICARNLPTEQARGIKGRILHALSNRGFHAKLKDDFAKSMKDMILNKGLKETALALKTELKPKSLYRCTYRGRYRVSDLAGLAKIFNIDPEKVYDNVSAVCYRTGAANGKSSLYASLPKNIERLFYIAGLFFGDGSGKNFIVGKPELAAEFIKICREELGIKTTLKEQAARTPEIITSMTLARMLNAIFDYPLKKKSHNIKASEILFSAPTSCSSQFIKGYFDCDGTVEKGRGAISITSASPQMLKDLQLLLVKFGCISIRQHDTLYIAGLSAKAFSEKIGFGLKNKQNLAEDLARKATGSRLSDLVSFDKQKMKAARTTSMNSISPHYYKYESGTYSPTIATAITIQQKLLTRNKETDILGKLLTGDLAFIEVSGIEESFQETVYDYTVADHHNFIAEGMVIHNTTFSDNLLAGAGMISEELAGKQLVLDFHEDEQQRGITIDAANVSMVYDISNEEYLINLIDTPGHVDFGGDVTRAMRAIDGSIVLVDCVEGIMPQTETVIRQALRERVKPVLFINKVDRLIKELKLTPDKMQERFIKVIGDFNKLVSNIAEKEYKEKWQVNVNEGSVCFGSAFHKWALSVPYMKSTGVSFKDVIDVYTSGSDEAVKELAKKAPLHRAVLGMVVKHHPCPIDAQKYRIPKIWQGDLESETGKSLLNCDPNGPLGFVCTKIVWDKHAGEVAAGRLFSGTVQQGQDVYMIMGKKQVRVQQVSVYNGAKREPVDKATAGNIIGIVGLKGVFSGETVSNIPEMDAFEAIKHIFEPVVTKAIEAKRPSDLPKLVEVLRQVSKEDPTIKIELNEETGEHLMSGMGELHLEVIENRIRKEKGVDVQTSEPIVVYRESINKPGPEMEGKSPNKHNKFYIKVEPLEDPLYQSIKEDKIREMRVKRKDESLWDALEEAGMDSKTSRRVRDIFNGNMLIDMTKGIVHIGEVIEMVMDSFEDVMKYGPLGREPCMKLKVLLMDTKLHEDAIHRGPAQVLPAVREAIRGSMLAGGPLLHEPMQILQIEGPLDHMGDITKLIQNRRGQMIDMQQEGEHISIKAKLPVAEMFGLTSDLRSATEGRGNFFVVDQLFERLPMELQHKVVQQIRNRKGLKDIEGVAMPA